MERSSTSNRGPSYFTQEGLDQIVSAADAAGLTVHIHAIGDRGFDRPSMPSRCQAPQRCPDNRDQIAHWSGAAGRLPALQAAQRHRELSAAVGHTRFLCRECDHQIPGPERSRHLYPARSLRDAGALIAAQRLSVSSFDAFEAMEHAITRARAGGNRAPAIGKLTLQDMVDATHQCRLRAKQERTTGA